ncbi:hypothetical protein KBD20_04445 [Candidatus Saccharibacteria bacterium]|nr:hypothetical protein [Candidatus Saccharibacteria bacterium]
MQENPVTQFEALTRTDSEQTRLVSSVGTTALTPEVIIRGFDELRHEGTQKLFTDLMSQTD